MNEQRHRLVARAFGVPRDESFLVSMSALGALVEALHGVAARARSVPARPSVGDTLLLGAAAAKETLRGVVGVRSSGTPLVSTLIVTAVLARSFRPVLAASLRRATARARGVRGAFDRRYVGYFARITAAVDRTGSPSA